MECRHTRREFFGRAGALAAAAAAVRAAEGLADDIPGPLPTIRLGDLEVSRLILGSNPFFGFAHGSPQATAEEMRQWYTPERVMAVMDQAAEQGVTAVWTPCYEHWVEIWNDYRRRNGKLEIWIAQPDRLPMERDIEIAVENGAQAVAIQGMRIDDQAQAGRWDVIAGWLELIKSHGLPAGMADHQVGTRDVATLLEAQRRELPADFFHQSLYLPSGDYSQGREEALAVIDQLTKPVVVFKALAAGRVLPEASFPSLFERLNRKDGVCVGVFHRDHNQIADSVALTRELTDA